MKSDSSLWCTMIGDNEAKRNINTGNKAEADLPPLSCVLPVMIAKQVRGVVMGYGGLVPNHAVLRVY